MKAKVGVTLIAAILIGVAVLSFVSYIAFDAVGYGKITENGEPFAPTWGTNQTITLRFSPAAQPVVTFWDAAGAVNGTVPTTNLTWYNNNQILVYHWNWTAYDTADCAPYGKDTSYLRFNYTSQGAAARSVAQPAIILCGVFAIVIVAGVMVAGTGRLGGKGGRKSFP